MNFDNHALNRGGLVVLSLCDGMSCGHIALDRAGIKVDKYFASEIKDIAIKVTQDNYPDTIQIGDVNKVFYKDGILHTESEEYKTQIDLVIFGSPCQTFSIAMKTEHRIGLDDKQKSGLFLECYRILKEINPRYFLMENVESMKDDDRDYITSLMGVKPVMIDSALVAPCMRKRYYWTNIPNVTLPKDTAVTFQSILDNGWTDRIKGHCMTVVDSRPATTPVKMFHRYYFKGFTNLIFKSKEQYEQCKKYYDEHYRGLKAKDIPVDETNIFDGVRFMNQSELERCQTVPAGYTKCLTRNEAADVLGDGWTVDVIAHIFSGINL